MLGDKIEINMLADIVQIQFRFPYNRQIPHSRHDICAATHILITEKYFRKIWRIEIETGSLTGTNKENPHENQHFVCLICSVSRGFPLLFR